MRRVLVSGGRIGLNVSGAPNRFQVALAEGLSKLGNATAAKMSLAPFAMTDPGVLQALLDEAGFDENAVHMLTLERRVEPTQEWLLQYSSGLPYADAIAGMEAVARAEMLRECLGRFTSHLREAERFGPPTITSFVAARRLAFDRHRDGGGADRHFLGQWRESEGDRDMRSLIATGILVSTLGSALAQNYPSRPITLIVPYPAGGPTDTVARVTGNAMSKLLGQNIVVENVAGAGGTIGAGRAARAEPDGYILLIHHLGLATAATLYRKLPYDIRTTFTPIGLTTDAPMIIIGRSNLQPNSLQELVAHAKARGKDFMFASAGLGSGSNLCGLMFMAAIKQEVSNVRYQGGGPLMNDLIGRQIDLGCEQATTATEPIKGKLVKAYAVTTKARLASLPDLPTADEAGLKGFEVNVWHGIFAPKGTPASVVQKLSTALKAALKDAEVVKRFSDINTVPVSEDRATPEALGKLLLGEIDRWAPVIKAANQFAD